jgi:hypothetical protein
MEIYVEDVLIKMREKDNPDFKSFNIYDSTDFTNYGEITDHEDISKVVK